MQAFRRHYRIMNIIYPGSTFVLVETKKIIIFNIRVIKTVSLTGISPKGSSHSTIRNTD